MQPMDDSTSRPSADESLADASQIPVHFGYGSGQVGPLFWHRLVDEELSEQEYRQMLVRLEVQPELWRDCALAFLEEQALKKALRSLGGGPARKPALGSMAGQQSTADRASQGLDRMVDRAVAVEADPTMLENGNLPLQRLPSVGSRTGVGLPLWRGFRRELIVPLVSAAAGFFLAWATWGSTSTPQSPMVLGDLSESTPRPAASELPRSESELYASLLANLSPTEIDQLFAKAGQRRIRSTVQATPAVLVPGELKANRHFLFYRDQNGNRLVLPVDDYQYIAQDFQ